jgi:hypothetical protein
MTRSQDAKQDPDKNGTKPGKSAAEVAALEMLRHQLETMIPRVR